MHTVLQVINQVRPVATTVSPGPTAHTCPVEPPLPAPAAQCRRLQARALAARDPQRARVLGIGRPDLGLDYDDGGLVELGGAPAATIAKVCGLTHTEAQRIVAARGDLLGIEDLLIAADVPVSQWGMVRDRALLYTAI